MRVHVDREERHSLESAGRTQDWNPVCRVCICATALPQVLQSATLLQLDSF